MINHQTSWSGPVRLGRIAEDQKRRATNVRGHGALQCESQPIEWLSRTPGMEFIGVTASGREIPCTVDENGNFHADSYEVCKIVGWKPR